MAHFDDSLQNKERPLSPNLTIYRPQISSVLSILHRITGVVLFVGILGVIWLIILGVYTSFDMAGFINAKLPPFLVKLLLGAWAYALFYHLFSGIKYLFWAAGIGFGVESVTRAGWAVITVSVLATIASWYIALL